MQRRGFVAAGGVALGGALAGCSGGSGGTPTENCSYSVSIEPVGEVPQVYRGGPLYQGPITNMVIAERQARQFYGYEGELFDRQRVSTVVNGTI